MIIWGLDLNAIRFGAFKSARMFDRRYYLRRERLIVYQLAMIFTVVGESLATNAIDKYIKQQRHVERHFPGVSIYNNDIVGAGSYTIFAGVFTASVYGTMFFFLVFWPTLPETRFWARTKRAGALFCSAVVTSACLLSTVIGARHAAHWEGADHAAAAARFPHPPLEYHRYSYVIGWNVFLWIGWVFALWSNYLVWKPSGYHLTNPQAVHLYDAERKQEDSSAALA